MKNYWQQLKSTIITWILYIIIYLSNLTINLKVVGKENLNNISPQIYSTWHRYIWLIVYYFRYSDNYTLASLSRDGEYITNLLQKLGWKVTRGSSSKGGARSLIKLYKLIRSGKAESVVLTPDGPTGPLYKVKPGIVYLQEKTDGYIIPLGFAVDSKKELSSWDKFVIPYPFTKVVMVIGDPVQLPEEKSIEKRCEIIKKKKQKKKKKAEPILKKIKSQ